VRMLGSKRQIEGSIPYNRAKRGMKEVAACSRIDGGVSPLEPMVFFENAQCFGARMVY
jgi:hypothetical protein